MAASARPSGGGRKRKSAFQALADLDGLDFDAPDAQQFFREKSQMEIKELESITFRWHAPRSQKKQDRLLEGYYHFVRSWYKEEFKQVPPPPQEVLDERAFPTELDGNGNLRQLAKMLNLFMMMAVRLATPRSLKDEVVGYSCMISYRKALLFWVDHKFRARGLTSPARSGYLWNAIVQNMRKIAHDTQMKLKRKPKTKTHLGLAELMQLIDMDARGTANIALAEGHHLAWCIARCCALRTGAIGMPPNDVLDEQSPLPFLTFGDFDVKRSSNPGEFDVTLRVRNLKLKGSDNAERTGYHTKTVFFTIKSPQKQHNLMLSVGHRFLVLALRRGALEDYSTIDGLLNCDKRHIRIKRDFIDRPVVVSGTARGLNILIDEPVRAKKLTEYLSLRGQRAGYSEPIHFYSIRRRAGTDLTKILGSDAAREVMCHDPDSRSMERYYLNTLPTADVSAVGLGEDHQARASEMQLETAHLALTKLPKEVVATYGKEVNALVRQTVIVDEIYQECTTDKERRNRERVLRRIALGEFIKQAHEEQRANMTVRDFKDRADDLVRKATDFNKRLLERIRTAAKTPASSQVSHESSDLDEDDELGDDEFEELPDQEEAEEVEDILAGQSRHNVIEEDVYSDEVANYVNLLEDVPYADAVRASMELMMENGLSEYSRQTPAECPLCLDDDTIRDYETKHKMWAPGHLKRHMLTAYHAPYQALVREAINKRDDNDEEKIECKFCAEIAPDDDAQIPSFTGNSRLTQHLKRSNSKLINGARDWSTPELAELHEGLKAAAGFFDPEFWGDLSDRNHERATKKSLDLRKLGDAVPAFRYSKDKALTAAIPFPGHRRLYMGSFWSVPMGLIELDIIKTGPAPTMVGAQIRERIDPRLLRGATYGPIPGAQRLKSKQTPKIHPEDAHLIRAVPPPGTAGNFIGQGNRIRDQLNGVGWQHQRVTEHAFTVQGKHSRDEVGDGNSQKKLRRM